MHNNERVPILIVEDSDEDFEMLKWAFKEVGIANPHYRICEGEKLLPTLIELCRSEPGPPGLIILDLNLIGLDGRAALRELKSDPIFCKIPVQIFSTSHNPKDVDECYAEGASSYSTKPVDIERFESFARQIKSYWLEFTILPRPSALEEFRGKNV